MIRAIIFDFGRVISGQKPDSLFHSYEAELGLTPGQLNRVMFDSAIWDDVQVGKESLDDYWREIAPILGLCSPDAVASFRQRYHADEFVNEGVVRLIERLHGQYKLAVLSNAPTGLEQWLADWQLQHFFDVVVVSADVGVSKPDPAIFLLTLERLGVAPHEAIFIDDTLGHVNAARALGLHGIHFDTAPALVEELERMLAPADDSHTNDSLTDSA